MVDALNNILELYYPVKGGFVRDHWLKDLKKLKPAPENEFLRKQFMEELANDIAEHHPDLLARANEIREGIAAKEMKVAKELRKQEDWSYDSHGRME